MNPDEFLTHLTLSAKSLLVQPEIEHAAMRSLVDNSKIAIAVWLDEIDHSHSRIMIIKGKKQMSKIFSGEFDVHKTLAIIPCSTAEQAAALQRYARGSTMKRKKLLH